MALAKKKLKAVPGFEVDPETGRYIPVPVDFRTLFGNEAKPSKPTQRSSKIPTNVHSMQAVKFSKTENRVSFSKRLEGLPGFDVDPETGRYVPVPVDFQAIFSNRTKRSNPSQSNSKKPTDAPSVQAVKFHKAENDISVMKRLEGLPGFDIDSATGRYVPVPVDFQAIFSNGTKRTKPNQSNSKQLTDDSSIQTAKCHKAKNGIRKELFPKHDQQNITETRGIKPKATLAGIRRTLSKPLASANTFNDVSKKLPEKKNSSSMKSLLGQVKSRPTGYPFKQVDTPQVKFTTKEDDCRKEDIKTPNSQEFNREFLKLEQLCKTPKITMESPVSSVCNLLESTMLLNADREDILKKPLNQKEIINDLKELVRYDSELYKDASKKIQEVLDMQVRHKQNIATIMTLIDKLDDNAKNELVIVNLNEDQKENNFVRRSLRLQNKSSPAGSPVIFKSDDLRKSALTKNLVFKCQKYQIESPRIRNALEMYNATKSTCNALLTPRISSMRSSLSIKVQQQCLMLQFSPERK